MYRHEIIHKTMHIQLALDLHNFLVYLGLNSKMSSYYSQLTHIITGNVEDIRAGIELWNESNKYHKYPTP